MPRRRRVQNITSERITLVDGRILRPGAIVECVEHPWINWAVDVGRLAFVRQDAPVHEAPAADPPPLPAAPFSMHDLTGLTIAEARPIIEAEEDQIALKRWRWADLRRTIISLIDARLTALGASDGS